LLRNKTISPFSQRYHLKTGDSTPGSNGRGPQSTDPNRIQVSGSVVVDQLKSITTVQKDASIKSSNNVTVQALGKYTGSATVTTASYFDGRAGLAFSVGYSSSDIEANVDGKITVTGAASSTGIAKGVFNPYKAVNFANSTIHFDTPDGF